MSATAKNYLVTALIAIAATIVIVPLVLPMVLPLLRKLPVIGGKY